MLLAIQLPVALYLGHALGLVTADWAFEETFDGLDPTSPSQDLLPSSLEYVVTHRTHPKEHFTKVFTPYPADHDASCVPPDPNISPLPQHMVTTGQNSSAGVDESFFICKNHFMSSMGDVGPYTVSAFYPRQEFRFSKRGKVRTLEFDVTINDGHTVRSWFEILITPRKILRVGAGPLDSPIAETYPVPSMVLSFRQTVRHIQVYGENGVLENGQGLPTIFNERERGPWDWSYWKDKHPNDPANFDHRIRRKMKIEFVTPRKNSNDPSAQIVWGIETQDGTMDNWTIDLPQAKFPFKKGMVLWKTHAYTPEKDGNMDKYTFHWKNLRFDGPVADQYESFRASDVVYLQRNGDRPIGDFQTVSIDLPPDMDASRNPVLFGQIHHPVSGQTLLRLNNSPNTIQVEPYDYSDEGFQFSQDWKSFRLDLKPHMQDLVQGQNLLTWTVGPRPSVVRDDFLWDGFSVKFLHIQMDKR